MFLPIKIQIFLLMFRLGWIINFFQPNCRNSKAKIAELNKCIWKIN